VVELVGATDASAALLATKLWCLPWCTSGPTSVLQALRGLPLPEQEAAARAALPHVDDPAFLDVAACLAGVSPAWSGGPLSWRS
jgi:3-hydroxyacyl-CoA dehydrogenase/enoyl-CoA hydratase/3-hydroxybutyryl-CoA epimerase